MSALKVALERPDSLKRAVAESGRLQDEVIAVGQLRQGKAPSTLGMVTGAALLEVLRPRRSQLLPRHFVLVATASELVAYKASGGAPENGPYEIHIHEEVAGRWPRGGARMTGLDEGDQSRDGTLVIGGESIPVARPNLDGDPSTDELFALLASE